MESVNIGTFIISSSRAAVPIGDDHDLRKEWPQLYIRNNNNLKSWASVSQFPLDLPLPVRSFVVEGDLNSPPFPCSYSVCKLLSTTPSTGQVVSMYRGVLLEGLASTAIVWYLGH